MAAVIASVAGVRPQTDSTPEATWILLVRSAISVSTGVESRPQPSGTANDSYPSSSASTAARTMTSRRVSIGVSPTPRRRGVTGHLRRPGRPWRPAADVAARACSGRGTVSQTAPATASTSPSGPISAEPAVSLRPSRRSGQAITRHGSPTAGRAARVVAVIRPSRMAVSQPGSPPRPAASAAAIPLGQSSAAQTTSARTLPSGPATEASGFQGAAHKRWPVTGPGKIRSPSPGRRFIPQTKQSGNTGSRKYRAFPAARSASAGDTVTAISGGPAGDGAASPISVRPCRTRTEPSSSRSTFIGVSSGGGRRSVTVAGPSTYAAIRPQT